MLRHCRTGDLREVFQARSIRTSLMASWTPRPEPKINSTSQKEHTNETRKDVQLDRLPRTGMEGGQFVGRRQCSDKLRPGLDLERMAGLGRGYVKGVQATVGKEHGLGLCNLSLRANGVRLVRLSTSH